jgi:hypothetical protein
VSGIVQQIDGNRVLVVGPRLAEGSGMSKLLSLLLAVVISLFTMGALAAATSGFTCDFVRVARTRKPACAPRRELVCMREGGVSGT